MTGIGDRAFEDCSGLTDIIISDSVKNIVDCTFYSCTSLASFTIPESVTSIGINAFSNCPTITIRCYADSYAEQYAIINGIPYELIATILPSDANGDSQIDNADISWLLALNEEPFYSGITLEYLQRVSWVTLFDVEWAFTIYNHCISVRFMIYCKQQ